MKEALRLSDELPTAAVLELKDVRHDDGTFRARSTRLRLGLRGGFLVVLWLAETSRGSVGSIRQRIGVLTSTIGGCKGIILRYLSRSRTWLYGGK